MLEKARPVKEKSVADTGAIMCTAGMETLSAMGAMVLVAVAVKISACCRTAYQIMYVSEVIRRIPAGTPTTWCSWMVVTIKADRSPRRRVDS